MSPHPRLEALRNDPDDHHVPARRTALLEDRLGHAGADVELVHLTSRARAVSDGSATESTPSLLDLPARAFASDEHVHPRRHSTSSRVLVRIGSVRNIANVPGLAQMSYKDLQFNAKIQERGLDFASYFHLNSIPEWRRKLVPASLCVAAVYIHYPRLVRLLGEMVNTPAVVQPQLDAAVAAVHIGPLVSGQSDGNDSHDMFLSELGNELNKVDTFFRSQMEYFRKRHADLEEQLRRFKGRRFVSEDPLPVEPFVSQHTLSNYVHELRERRQMHMMRDSFKSAVYEFVRGIGMLQSYCSLNKLAALNLVNKYELLSKRDATAIEQVVTDMVNACEFPFGTEEMTVMEEGMNDLFMETFYPNNDKGDDVMQPVQLKRKYQRATFVIGVCLGISIALIILCAYLIATTPSMTALPNWSSMYLIFRGSFLALLAVAYTGINMYCWRLARINFRFIAEIGRHRISHQQLHLVVAPLAALSFLFFTLYILTARGDLPSVMPPRYFGFIQLVMMFGFLFCPFNILHRSTRGWLLRKTLRVMTAPFWKVRFLDFFLGDQFMSMLMVFYDLEFSVCFLFFSVWTDSDACLVQAPHARLALAGMPGLWRLLQCLRRYRDSRDYNNLLNAGKYSSGLLVVVLAGAAFGQVGLTPLRVSLIVASVIATLAGCYWDIFRDFGFFARGSKHRFLRNELMYTRRWVYYAIIPIDCLLRITWIFTIAPASFGIFIPSDIFLFCLAMGELTRRFLWNFFRMENESANNCGNFRAVKDVPLPLGDEPEDDQRAAPPEGLHRSTSISSATPMFADADATPEELREIMKNHFDDHDVFAIPAADGLLDDAFDDIATPVTEFALTRQPSMAAMGLGGVTGTNGVFGLGKSISGLPSARMGASSSSDNLAGMAPLERVASAASGGTGSVVLDGFDAALGMGDDHGDGGSDSDLGGGRGAGADDDANSTSSDSPRNDAPERDSSQPSDLDVPPFLEAALSPRAQQVRMRALASVPMISIGVDSSHAHATDAPTLHSPAASRSNSSSSDDSTDSDNDQAGAVVNEVNVFPTDFANLI